MDGFTDGDATRLKRLIEEIVNQRLRDQPEYHWGVVTAVNTTARTCSVELFGDTGFPSEGFTYSANDVPTVGAGVRVCIQRRTDDRWVDKCYQSVLTLPKVRVTSTGDATVSSTEHGIQVGPTTGTNLIIDQNEVMVRSNGVAGNLLLNPDGGDVSVNAQSVNRGQPWFIPPPYNTGGPAGTFFSANRCAYIPIFVPVPLTITGFQIRVGTSSGNIGLAIFDEAGTRLQTTGSIACPASGRQFIDMTDLVVNPGRYWIGFSCSNSTATFAEAADDANAQLGIVHYQETAHPPPATFTLAGASNYMPCVMAMVTGGLSIT